MRKLILKKNANLYSANAEQSRFLNVKLGVGTVKMDCEFNYERPAFIIKSK